jgi:hypothetical protein
LRPVVFLVAIVFLPFCFTVATEYASSIRFTFGRLCRHISHVNYFFTGRSIKPLAMKNELRARLLANVTGQPVPGIEVFSSTTPSSQTLAKHALTYSSRHRAAGHSLALRLWPAPSGQSNWLKGARNIGAPLITEGASMLPSAWTYYDILYLGAVLVAFLGFGGTLFYESQRAGLTKKPPRDELPAH